MGSLFEKNLSAIILTALLAITSHSLCAETTNIKPVTAKVSSTTPQYPTAVPAKGVNPELVARGEYLAKMGDCIACHTNLKNGTPAYAGGLPLATPFGTFYSPNITPDKETGIGNWTEEDFVKALKQGRDPKGRNYFPVFPYIYFSKTTDEDAKAMYAYFMSIPPVKQQNRSLPFPFNLPGVRTTLWGWNLLFFYPDNNEIKYEKNRSPEWNRGKYIVDGLGHCSMCHTPLNVFGGPKTQHYLTGTFIDGYWAPNITKQGLGAATPNEIVNVFKNNELLNNAGPVAGPMAEVNNDSLRWLSDADLQAVATYIKTVETPDPLSLPASKEAPSLARGKQVYTEVCVICHQDGQMSAPIIGDPANWYMRLKSSGLTGLYRHVIQGFNSMPIKGACVTCSDNDIISSVNYILHKSLTHAQWQDVKNKGAVKYSTNGINTYNDNCAVCHKEGKNGAPKTGDKAVWKPIIAQNMDVMIEKTTNGKAHPKNGGCAQCTPNEIIEAIKYMVSQSKSEGNYSLW